MMHIRGSRKGIIMDFQELKIEYWPVEKLIPYVRNPRKNDAQVDKMVGAIREFGFRIPIVAKSDGSVVDGHLRLKAAQNLGLSEVPVVLADELTEAQVKAFRLLANRVFGENDDDGLPLDEKYISKIDIPQYEPTGKHVELMGDCCMTERYEQFIKDVDASSCSDAVKSFLRLAATRHIKFNYRAIAEYYANDADAEVQNLFERLALVIIDYDDAMKYGYVKISKELENIVGVADE